MSTTAKMKQAITTSIAQLESVLEDCHYVFQVLPAWVPDIEEMERRRNAAHAANVARAHAVRRGIKGGKTACLAAWSEFCHAYWCNVDLQEDSDPGRHTNGCPRAFMYESFGSREEACAAGAAWKAEHEAASNAAALRVRAAFDALIGVSL